MKKLDFAGLDFAGKMMMFIYSFRDTIRGASKNENTVKFQSQNLHPPKFLQNNDFLIFSVSDTCTQVAVKYCTPCPPLLYRYLCTCVTN